MIDEDDRKAHLWLGVDLNIFHLIDFSGNPNTFTSNLFRFLTQHPDQLIGLLKVTIEIYLSGTTQKRLSELRAEIKNLYEEPDPPTPPKKRLIVISIDDSANPEMSTEDLLSYVQQKLSDGKDLRIIGNRINISPFTFLELPNELNRHKITLYASGPQEKASYSQLSMKDILRVDWITIGSLSRDLVLEDKRDPIHLHLRPDKPDRNRGDLLLHPNADYIRLNSFSIQNHSSYLHSPQEEFLN